MFNFFSKNDARILNDTKDELLADPKFDASHIDVTVVDGIATLRGTVTNFVDKHAVEQAVQRVGGVRAIVDEIDVNALETHARRDDDIAAAALSALRWDYYTPDELKLVVDNGWITLSGEALWAFQRNEAEHIVGRVKGVRGVTNKIVLRSTIQPIDIRVSVEMALKRLAAVEAHKIEIEIDGDCVKLTGKVNSLFERRAAEDAVFQMAGVRRVENNLTL